MTRQQLDSGSECRNLDSPFFELTTDVISQMFLFLVNVTDTGRKKLMFLPNNEIVFTISHRGLGDIQS